MQTAGEPPPKPPKLLARTNELTCAALVTGGLLLGAFFCSGLALLLPWWTWEGQQEDDFWGVEKKVVENISPMNACTSTRPAGEPSGATCAVIGTMITFNIASGATSLGAALICFLAAFRFKWLCLLILSALLGYFGAFAQGLTLVLAFNLQPTGLDGLGYYASFGAIFLDWCAAAAAIWGANKATPSKADLARLRGDTGPPRHNIVDRNRQARQAAQAFARTSSRTRVSWQASDSASVLSSASCSSLPQSSMPEEIPEEASDVASSSRRRLFRLSRVIDWGHDPNTAGRPLPEKLLQDAFTEIDRDLSGEITRQEFADALGACGFHPSKQVMDLIMNEIDADCTGNITMDEFVGFFKMAEELDDFQKKQHSRSAFASAVCSCCFLGNLIAWAAVGIMWPSEDDPDTAGALADMFKLLSVTLLLLFCFNVAVPMIILTLGSSLSAWSEVASYRIQEFMDRHKRRAAEKAAQEKKIEDDMRRAAEFEAGKMPSDAHSSSLSPVSPLSRADGEGRMLALGPGSPGGASSSRSPSPPRTVFAAPEIPDAASYDDEEDDMNSPGVYMVMHDGTAVRAGISVASKKLRVLRRGMEVRIVEVFEYKKQRRFRGRLEQVDGEPRGWISLMDTEDEYKWAQRKGPLQVAKMPTRRISNFGADNQSIGTASVLSPKSRVSGGGKSMASSRSRRKSMKVNPEETSGAPAYAPEEYYEAQQYQDETRFETCFGLMQVKDPKLYKGEHEEFPIDRFVRGGLPTGRGEWKIGLNKR